MSCCVPIFKERSTTTTNDRFHYQRKLRVTDGHCTLVPLEGWFHLARYKICGKCPRCGCLNFLDVVDDENYTVREPLLRSILHAVICIRCGEQFGTQAGAHLVHELEPSGC